MIILTQPSSYWGKEGNLLIGYHIETQDTRETLNGPSLSLQTLHDDSVLYLCNNYREWYPSHLKDQTIEIFKVAFEFPGKEVVFTIWKEYMCYNPPYRKTQAPQKLKLIHNEINLFSLGKNDRNELTEAYLVNPTKYVKSITKLQSR